MQISFGGDPPLLEQISWGSQAVLVVVAIIAAIYAAAQLKVMRRISQATFLLELDARFDSDDLRGARQLFAKLCEDITTIVSNDHPLAGDQAKIAFCDRKWKEILGQMRSEDEENYLSLMAYLGFFETVGMMVKKEYITQEDVFDLFRGALVDVYQCFYLHIEERQNEVGVPKGLFEHALKLGKEATA